MTLILFCWAMLLWTSLIWIYLRARFLKKKAKVSPRAFFPTQRKLPVIGASQRRFRNAPKSGRVITTVLKLCAIHPKCGCRSIATLANAQLADIGETVSKSWVARYRNAQKYAIVQLRRSLRKPPRAIAPNQLWAMDFTEIGINRAAHFVLGVIDHGSRKLLHLSITRKSSGILTRTLTDLVLRFGKPKAIRTDNEIAFCSDTIENWFEQNCIKHQRTQLRSPWQNGRIERLFGTFKRAIRQIQLHSNEQLETALAQFKDFYNMCRPHQHLRGLTPDMVWRGQFDLPRVSAHIVSLWNGVIVGYRWKTGDG